MIFARIFAIILNIALAYLVYPSLAILQYTYFEMSANMSLPKIQFHILYGAGILPFLIVLSIIMSSLALLGNKNHKALLWSLLPFFAFACLLFVLSLVI